MGPADAPGRGRRRYAWGLGLAYANGTTVQAVYHGDGLGSTRTLTDAAGVLTRSYETDEFGVTGASAGTGDQPFGYTGELRDAETGLLNLRARTYDAETGPILKRAQVAQTP